MSVVKYNLSKKKIKERLPTYSSFSTFNIYDDLNVGDMSCGNCYNDNDTQSQWDCDYNNGDVSSGYGLLNSHTLYQCEDSISSKEMYGVVKKV